MGGIPDFRAMSRVPLYLPDFNYGCFHRRFSFFRKLPQYVLVYVFRNPIRVELAFKQFFGVRFVDQFAIHSDIERAVRFLANVHRVRHINEILSRNHLPMQIADSVVDSIPQAADCWASRLRIRDH
jgi:hypothetical protein